MIVLQIIIFSLFAIINVPYSLYVAFGGSLLATVLYLVLYAVAVSLMMAALKTDRARISIWIGPHLVFRWMFTNDHRGDRAILILMSVLTGGLIALLSADIKNMSVGHAFVIDVIGWFFIWSTIDTLRGLEEPVLAIWY